MRCRMQQALAAMWHLCFCAVCRRPPNVLGVSKCKFAQFCRDARPVRPLCNQLYLMLIYKWLTVPCGTRTHGPCVPTRWVLLILIHHQALLVADEVFSRILGLDT